jgi:hypothetical protein
MDLGRRGNVPHEDARGTCLHRDALNLVVLIHPSINDDLKTSTQSCIYCEQ